MTDNTAQEQIRNALRILISDSDEGFWDWWSVGGVRFPSQETADAYHVLLTQTNAALIAARAEGATWMRREARQTAFDHQHSDEPAPGNYNDACEHIADAIAVLPTEEATHD